MKSQSPKFDIAIIGAGASGLMAACSAGSYSKSKKKIALIEGNNKAGKKLLATGNGRCNLTNIYLSEKNYHGDSKAAMKILSTYTPKMVIDEFEKMGLVTMIDSEGRVYPRNQQASAVLKILRNSCEEKGVTYIGDFPVFSVVRVKEGFVIKSENGEEICAKKCIISTGGLASPKHSCPGEWQSILKHLGHSLTPLSPSLVQITVIEKIAKSLKGMRTKTRARLIVNDEEIYAESGEVIFADKALSGICIFNLSSYIADCNIKNSKQKLEISLDIVEDKTVEEIENYIKNIIYVTPNIPCADLLSGLINMKIGQEIVSSLSIDIKLPVSQLSEDKIIAISNKLKDFRFTVTGLGGYENAQITAGGVPLSEVDVSTMQSNVCRDLYLTGELLNVNGDCGGYNLQFAWTTGMLAGKSAADSTIYK